MSKVRTIQEIEAMNAQEPYFGKGIQLAGGFDLGAKAPLDSRSVVKTIAERDAHITGNRAYEGMLVYVEADKTTYQLVDGKFKKFGADPSETNDAIQNAIVDDLVTGGSDKALSAEQGKVLKGMIDDLDSKVDVLEETLTNTITEKVEEVKTTVEGALNDFSQEVTDKIAEVNQSITDVDTKVDNVKTEVEDLRQEVTNNQSGLADRVAALENSQDEQDNLLADHTAKITENSDKLDDHELRLTALESIEEITEEDINNIIASLDTI